MSGSCNICGEKDSETMEFGAMKSNGSSGSIGMEICSTCRKAAEWHAKNGGSQCVSCGSLTPERTVKLTQPTPQETDSWEVKIEICRDCYSDGGFMHMYESDTDFRARSNILGSWDEQRQIALSRDSYECQSCGVDQCRLHVHHKIPRAEGGTDHIDNLVCLCPDCHAERHGKQSCMLCGGVTDKSGTWLVNNGGLGVYVCEECQQYIKRGSGSERCSICATFTNSDTKSDGIAFFDNTEGEDDVKIYNACEKCRRALALEPWPTRQKYVDVLPDSHVNVRHWEGADD